VCSTDFLKIADFYNWNRVKVRYCDGSSFTGDVAAVESVCSGLVDFMFVYVLDIEIGPYVCNTVYEPALQRGKGLECHHRRSTSEGDEQGTECMFTADSNKYH
jgi:hypothetical protein